ncbi:homoserine dehydrogenase [Hyphomicrobium methylovorum]|uniref:homoserine dehydrogenase n=1 Tax=Hyphomicrobium methylovorum TaxID=84 RepID=UPI0015E7591A|nr:homoserine dehydrogenase [Hyphomicrobium methylovorum]MBA2124654.1 homoserine dehydrogenase [Hyphomicrobium methylovorum]
MKPLTLGIAGIGTVGGALLNLLDTNGSHFSRILGRDIRVTGVSARTRNKQRDALVKGATWFDDPVALAKDPSNEVFVELIGGDSGIVKEAVEAALKAKKHVVTANKALLAKHGIELAQLAEANGVALNFEAAVAGGIPVIKTMREALGANRIRRVYGILNGTCNFILTKMQSEKRPFDEVLKEAQALGYAEADPSFDIGGFDAAHKLALLTSLAFGTRVAFDQIHVEGITSITEADIEAADSLGYRVKLLGVATETDSGIEARVSPALVFKDSAIAEVSDVTNAVAIEGDFSGSILLVGAGAGGNPTASAVAGDILDIARGLVVPPFVTPSAKLKDHKRAPLDRHYGSYYVRLALVDRPGAMAGIAKSLGDQGVSLESIVQHRPQTLHAPRSLPQRTSDGAQPVIIITHETTEAAMRKALATIETDGNVTEPPQMIRIEEL